MRVTAELKGVPGAERHLTQIPATFAARLRTRFENIEIAMQSQIKGSKLSGQVLHRRTGALSRSIHGDIEQTPQSLTANIYAGREAPYAKVHEYGLTVHVPPSFRTMLFGKVARFPFFVPAHDIEYPERSFLRTTLREWRDRIVEAVRRTIREAARLGESFS